MLRVGGDLSPLDLHRRCAAVRSGFRGGQVRIEEGARVDAALLCSVGRTVQAHEQPLHVCPGPGIGFEEFRIFAGETDRAIGIVSGDPSPFTALGAFAAIRGAVGGPDGVRVAIQGVGRVGGRLAGLLAEAGADLVVADLDPDQAEEIAAGTGAEVVDPERILDVDCDVFSPNARGAALTTESVPRLRCRFVVGAANGQIGDAKAPAYLALHRIRHVPEEIAGSGWILNLATELDPGGWTEESARARVMEIERLVTTLVPGTNCPGSLPGSSTGGKHG
ncbi:MAG: Rossmann-fold NAD(P)-binding domain-containing protein [Planctomycetota bacterium]|jgi:leucine dehydrogenase